MIHRMNLHRAPFDMMKSGQKTIELRLYDEKRQRIEEGDRIIFTATDNGEELIREVEALLPFDSFANLYKIVPLLKCGYTEADIDSASLSDMDAYYTPEQQAKYGVLAIELKDSVNGDELKWTTESRRELLHTPVFDVIGQQERSATGLEGAYIAVDAPDWVMVIPEYHGSFLLVRQWRHAAECLSLEFPGGVADGGEDPAVAAARELMEETGYKANSLIRLGTVSPNPALFRNRYHVYLARDLVPTGEQRLDDDELLTYELMRIEDVIDAYGTGEFTHGLMGTALAFYLRWMMKERKL